MDMFVNIFSSVKHAAVFTSLNLCMIEYMTHLVLTILSFTVILVVFTLYVSRNSSEIHSEVQPQTERNSASR